MYPRINPAVIRKLWFGMIVFGLLGLCCSIANAQNYGQCTASVFVNQISLYGGTGAGLAIDGQDNLYVAENINNRGITPQGPFVSKVTPQGTTSIVVPKGILGDVTGLAVDAQDNLYVADGNGNGGDGSTPKNKVWKVTPQGNISSFISGINDPTGLAFDAEQNLYVASFRDLAVYKYSAAGAFLDVVTSGLPDSPYGIALDTSGNLFIAGFGKWGGGSGGTQIYKVSPQGQRTLFVDPGFADPYSLVFDNQGYLYASYYNSLKIVRIGPDGSYTVFPGGCSGDDAANGLAIDSHGFLYTAVNGERTTGPPAVLKLSGLVPPPYDPNLDTTPPLLIVPGDMNVAASSSLGEIVSYLAIGSDEYYLPMPAACSVPSGSLFPIGTTPVTCVTMDAAGNMSAPRTFNISVVDAAPTLSLPPYISTDTTTSLGAQVNYFASADDAVSGELPAQCSPASGSTFAVGITIVTCSAIDGAGNTTYGSFNVFVLNGEHLFTPADDSITLQPVNGPTITFYTTSVGLTTVTPIDAASLGTTPAGFALSNGIAYQISTTATFEVPAMLAFTIPGPVSETDFNNLRILHNQNGELVDVTRYWAYDPQSQSGTITALTDSFSPFYLVKKVNLKVAALFDQTKAFKAGSTVPVKLQLIDDAGANVSAAATPIKARNLVRLGAGTTAAVMDAGNANPDLNFRFDPTLRGYIFNLSTKGLAAGQYVLSFYVGSDRSFFYTMKFEVK